MLLPLAAIAVVFFGIWVLAVAVEFWIRPPAKPRSATELPKSNISLGSLLLLLFASTTFIDRLPPWKFEAKSQREAN